MDNPTRSERSRNAAIQAALTIIARDGPNRLTLDAIARESGMSKGGLMHQFQSKDAVLKALMERQFEHFEAFSQEYLAGLEPGTQDSYLISQIAVLREATDGLDAVAFAILGAVASDPGLLAGFREIDSKRADLIRAETADPDVAMLRLVAAQGLLLTTLLGLSPLSVEDRERLFGRLLDSSQWPSSRSVSASDTPSQP
ncbi:TetR family transcriptional regulator [Kaistia algarum]|uniref:TetR/AcrR family transcriptional regulator n=1 Tax=Kaistia algarum TaxID=2083279 RepID=UPI000CE7F043|nr:TetR/AcrR family transcriptional regulator [Kaistia algarum]MCX5512182.1 TetR/AcrR family transcriptional regulator [Kaistia algarum]PPE80280.1 TetR family transcriptional regulator [Kaistia algarum]